MNGMLVLIVEETDGKHGRYAWPFDAPNESADICIRLVCSKARQYTAPTTEEFPSHKDGRESEPGKGFKKLWRFVALAKPDGTLEMFDVDEQGDKVNGNAR